MLSIAALRSEIESLAKSSKTMYQAKEFEIRLNELLNQLELLQEDITTFKKSN